MAGLAASRAEAVWMAVIEPLQLRASLAGRLSRFLARQLDVEVSTATLISVAVQLAVALGLALALRARRSEGAPVPFALAVVAAFSAIPRMAGYDAFAFGPAVFVAFMSSLEEGAYSRSARVALVALFAGLAKEGLALLPLLALAAVWLRRPWKTPGRGAPSGPVGTV